MDPSEDLDITQKFTTIDDYINDCPLSDPNVELTVDLTQAELIFNKPTFDMAIIITHTSLISEICHLQNHFHTKHKFTTHCIFIPDVSKLKLCIRDLKSHRITYAIVINEDGLKKDLMDLYVLYPIIEIQRKMNLEEVDELVSDDSLNTSRQIKTLMEKPSKYPHPKNEFHVNCETRYHLCLLSDNRMLHMSELQNVYRFLNQRKSDLERSVAGKTVHIDDRPLEACRQERLKYYIYEPKLNENQVVSRAAISPRNSFTTQDAQRPSEKLNIGSNFNATTSFYQPPTKYLNQPIHEQPIMHRAKIITNTLVSNLQRIKGILNSKGQIKPFSYEIIQGGGVLKSVATRKNDSGIEEYSKSNYFINQNLWRENEDIISLSSGSCTPPIEYDLIPISPPEEQITSSKVDLGKRKSATVDLPESNSLPKLHKIDLRKPEIATSASVNKNTPDVLVNLFRFIAGVMPYDLPHDNSVLNILINNCNDIQNGIMEPSLKIVKIDYESCKINGANEIIKSIYGIYEIAEKNVDDIIDLQYIWKKYFPDHLSHFSLLVVFYKFVKMLVIFRLFNSQSDRLQIISNTVEKLNLIVNFDFYTPILSGNQHLNCITELFGNTFENHSDLHIKYFDLPLISEIPISNKKLDNILKKRKLEFVLRPLLKYFVNTLKSIHQQMKIVQAESIYKALRSLRYCLRVIYPIDSSTKNFNVPKIFSETGNNGHKDIQDEIKWLLDEIKYYQCVLFTEKHYDFINCLLDFSFMVEGIIDSDSSTSRTNSDSLVVLDADQFIESFTAFEGMNLQYHSHSEISYLKNFLKESWVNILQKAFRGLSTDGKGKRIVKEINNLLPELWGLKTFDEAVVDAAQCNYTEWTKTAQNNPSGWHESFSKVKFAGIVWLNSNQLSLSKAVEELQRCENMLKNEFLHSS